MLRERLVLPKSGGPPETLAQEFWLPREIGEPAVEMTIAFWWALVSLVPVSVAVSGEVSQGFS